MACRSESRTKAAIDDLKNVTGREAKFLELDLGDLASVKRAAETFIQYALRRAFRLRAHCFTGTKPSFIFCSTTRLFPLFSARPLLTRH